MRIRRGRMRVSVCEQTASAAVACTGHCMQEVKGGGLMEPGVASAVCWLGLRACFSPDHTTRRLAADRHHAIPAVWLFAVSGSQAGTRCQTPSPSCWKA
jgi:hypothetical protein